MKLKIRMQARSKFCTEVNPFLTFLNSLKDNKTLFSKKFILG